MIVPPEMLPYYGPNRSEFFHAVEAHLRARGITCDRKISSLTYRWIAQKGYRAPIAPHTGTA